MYPWLSEVMSECSKDKPPPSRPLAVPSCLVTNFRSDYTVSWTSLNLLRLRGIDTSRIRVTGCMIHKMESLCRWMTEEKIAGWPLDRKSRKGDDVVPSTWSHRMRVGSGHPAKKKQRFHSHSRFGITEFESVGSRMDPFLTIPAYPIERLPMT